MDNRLPKSEMYWRAKNNLLRMADAMEVKKQMQKREDKYPKREIAESERYMCDGYRLFGHTYPGTHSVDCDGHCHEMGIDVPEYKSGMVLDVSTGDVAIL